MTRFKIERCHGVGIGAFVYPPSDMSGWSREFVVYIFLWVFILKVWR